MKIEFLLLHNRIDFNRVLRPRSPRPGQLPLDRINLKDVTSAFGINLEMADGNVAADQVGRFIRSKIKPSYSTADLRCNTSALVWMTYIKYHNNFGCYL